MSTVQNRHCTEQTLQNQTKGQTQNLKIVVNVDQKVIETLFCGILWDKYPEPKKAIETIIVSLTIANTQFENPSRLVFMGPKDYSVQWTTIQL